MNPNIRLTGGLLEKWEDEQDAKRATGILDKIKKGKMKTYSETDIIKKLKE